jgi:HK97 family phage major capsid protein
MKNRFARWHRADAPGAKELKAALDKLLPGQRLRVADIPFPDDAPEAGADEPQGGERRGDAGQLAETRACGYAQLEQRAKGVDADTREFDMALSSEEPYGRWWGIEVLGHRAGEIDLAWLDSGRAPLLADHSRWEQIGVIVKAWVGEDMKCRCVARLGHSERAEQEMRDIQAGVRINVSVGYEIEELELVKVDGEEKTYRATRWKPLEGSTVSIPADMTVGIGRSAAQPPATPALPATPRNHQEHTMPEGKKPEEQTGDAAFRTAVGNITRLADAYSQWVKPGDVTKAIADGADAQKFQDMIMERMKTPAQDVTTTAALGANERETQQYSFLRAIQAQIPGSGVDAGREREFSRAIAKALGREPEGIFIPADLFGSQKQQRDFLAGTAGQAGNLIQTSVMGDMFTDVLRPALVMARLGITILPGLRSNVAIPRKSVAGTLAMLTEVATAAETEPTTVQATLTPKRIGAFTEPSKQAIIQSEVGIEAMIRDDLITGGAVLIENQGINGSGAGANSRGIRNVSGIGSVVGGTNGANFAWSHVTGLEAACANANAASTERAGYLINTKIVNTAKNTQKAANLPFIWDDGDRPLNGYRAGITNNVPSNLTKGTSNGVCSSAIFSSDWSMFVLGLFGGLDVTVDPYSLATTGQVRITLNQFIDWLCRQPGAFASMDDALTP